MRPSTYTRGLEQGLKAAAVPQDALPMARYMKNQFAFLGVKKTPRKQTIDSWIALHGLPEPGGPLEDIVRRCFASPYREMHYAGLYLLEKNYRRLASDHYPLLEELICTHSWWDTVDWLAKLAGMHFRRFPELVPVVPDRWMDSGHMWLQRVAILFQLAYKDKTNSALLYRYILRVADSKAFFLQKAAGWALRQYSRTDPLAVATFLRVHTLPALTRREGGRLLPRSIPVDGSVRDL
jgi:3-methyladenine DNA glycosylase AlkD